MLQTLLAYVRGAGIDARWLVIQGDADFFAITKRIHNGLYGSPGDGGPLGAAERRHYEAVLRATRRVAGPGPPGGHRAAARSAAGGPGRRRLWRAVPVSSGAATSAATSPTSGPSARGTSCAPISRTSTPSSSRAPRSHRPGPTPRRMHVIPPSIDPFSAKNEPMSRRNVRLALGYVRAAGRGAAACRRSRSPAATARPGASTARSTSLQTGPPPPPDAPLVVQVSRWDRMKDMAGRDDGLRPARRPGARMRTWCSPGPRSPGSPTTRRPPRCSASASTAVAPAPARGTQRIHLACMPMVDPDEKAAIVNALQRHAAVVVQKSLAEGFGLTVAEAMWKARPIVASAVGGIVDQVVSREHGLLVEDPGDLAGLRDGGRAAPARPRGGRAAGAKRSGPSHHGVPGRSAPRAVRLPLRPARLSRTVFLVHWNAAHVRGRAAGGGETPDIRRHRSQLEDHRPPAPAPSASSPPCKW